MEVDYRKPRHLHVQVYVYNQQLKRTAKRADRADRAARKVANEPSEPQVSHEAGRRATSMHYTASVYTDTTARRLLGHCFGLLSITPTTFGDLAITTARTKARG